jgi:CHAT domain-containing protein
VNGHFNLGVYYSDKNQKLATQQYKRALKLCNNKCHQLYFSILMYLIDDPTQHHYVDTLLQYRNCSDELQSKISFLIPGYIDIDLISNNRTQKVGNILESRKNADKLYPGYSTLHLQNYFIGNYVNLLNLFTPKTNISDKETSLIVNTCYDTRRRDLLRQELQSSMEGDMERRSTINNLLNEVNEFKEYYQDKKDKYEKLFDNFISINEIEKKNEATNIDLALLKKKLISDDAQLLNIVNSFDNYLYYLYDGDRLIVDTINTKNIEEKGKELYSSTLKKDEFEIKYLLDILKKIPLKSHADLVIISDGIFKSLPLAEIFSAHRVLQFSNVEKYMHSDSLIIKNCGLYNYSTEESINDKFKKVVPELKYGLQEIKKIKQILANTGINIVNYENLNFDKINSQLIHASSHAYSSNKNRLDNYIYHRTQNNPPEKIFGFSIYEKPKLPEIVILSACETGIGIPATGAGVQTLSRAFLDNGTQTVIKTLWKVNEKATAEFMIEMYTHWVTGISLYDALEKTKDHFKGHEKYSHPYYWAGFVLEGNPNVYLEKSEKEN